MHLEAADLDHSQPRMRPFQHVHQPAEAERGRQDGEGVDAVILEHLGALDPDQVTAGSEGPSRARAGRGAEPFRGTDQYAGVVAVAGGELRHEHPCAGVRRQQLDAARTEHRTQVGRDHPAVPRAPVDGRDVPVRVFALEAGRDPAQGLVRGRVVGLTGIAEQSRHGGEQDDMAYRRVPERVEDVAQACELRGEDPAHILGGLGPQQPVGQCARAVHHAGHPLAMLRQRCPHGFGVTHVHLDVAGPGPGRGQRVERGTDLPLGLDLAEGRLDLPRRRRLAAAGYQGRDRGRLEITVGHAGGPRRLPRQGGAPEEQEGPLTARAERPDAGRGNPTPAAGHHEDVVAADRGRTAGGGPVSRRHRRRPGVPANRPVGSRDDGPAATRAVDTHLGDVQRRVPYLVQEHGDGVVDGESRMDVQRAAEDGRLLVRECLDHSADPADQRLGCLAFATVTETAVDPGDGHKAGAATGPGAGGKRSAGVPGHHDGVGELADAVIPHVAAHQRDETEIEPARRVQCLGEPPLRSLTVPGGLGRRRPAGKREVRPYHRPTGLLKPQRERFARMVTAIDDNGNRIARIRLFDRVDRGQRDEFDGKPCRRPGRRLRRHRRLRDGRGL